VELLEKTTDQIVQAGAKRSAGILRIVGALENHWEFGLIS